MKLSNIFKKETKTVVKANVEKLEKKHLEKVIGGGDGDALREKLKATTKTQGDFNLSN
jgi:predicted membrane-bound spermidine synthase